MVIVAIHSDTVAIPGLHIVAVRLQFLRRIFQRRSNIIQSGPGRRAAFVHVS